MKFDHFIDERVLKRSEDFDILAQWKSNGLKYPTLQRIARDILAISITTIASEFVFSTRETVKFTLQQTSSQDYRGNDVCSKLAME